MSYRVAVASTDGKYVNEHFGRAEQFLIFEIEGSEYKFIELRKNQPSCHREEPDENRHNHVIRLLSDCRAVLVARIGPGASAVLEEAGIKPLMIPNFIDDALREVMKLSL